MALSGDQEREVFARVRNLILQDYHGDFEDMYSYAVTVLERAPEQANNEVRNALNHIARALLADDQAKADDNILQAKGHIERAKRDCVKLAVIHLHEQVSSDLLNVELTEGAVPMTIKNRFRTIVRAGVAARRAEADGAENILDRYSDVLADLQEFGEDIKSRFAVPAHPLPWWRHATIRSRMTISAFVGGVFIAIAGHWVYDNIGHWWPTTALAAASTPSTDAKSGGAKPPAKSPGTVPR